MVSNESERREHTRLPKSYRVELREFKFPISAQKSVALSCVDISSGGLAVDSPRKFVFDEMVQVKIYIPRLNKYHPGYFKVFESDVDQFLQAVAKVAWVKEIVPFSKYQLGLEFVDVYEDDWKALQSMISKSILDER